MSVTVMSQRALQERLAEAVAGLPGPVPPIDAVAAALEAAGALVQERRESVLKRQAIIAATPELHERELLKLATLTSALADAIRRRGTADPAASLAAEAGTAAFKIAFEHWISEDGGQDLPRLIRESFAQLKAVAAGA